MRTRWWLGLLFVVWAGSLCAEPVADAYQARIIVAPPRNQAETNAALREAFLVALVRISGEPNARDNKSLLKKAENVEPYIDRYSYHTLDKMVKTQDGQSVHTKELTVSFAPHLMDQLLAEAKFSIWKVNRPLILVLTKDEQNHFASTTHANTLGEQLQTVLYQRGLSVVLPIMDTDDLLVLGNTFATPSADQWQMLQERYHYQAVLTGELTQTTTKESESVWSGKWQLAQNEHTVTFTEEEKDQQAVLEKLAAQLADALLKSAALVNNPHEWMIYVQGIHDDDEYKMVRQYLEQLPLVKQVKFIKLENETVSFQIGSDAGLEKLINSESALLPDTQNKNTESDLYYVFNVLP